MRKQPKDDPDGPLIEGIAKGDPRSVEALINRHSDSLYALSYRMMGTRSEAEDVVQETFLRAWTHAASWVPGRAVYKTWLYRVSMNLCRDRLRKRKDVSSEGLPEVIDESRSAEKILTDTERDNKVRIAVHRLPERQRIAIELCHFQEIGNAQTADIMDTTVEAVESLLSRGRKRLRDLLIHEDIVQSKTGS